MDALLLGIYAFFVWLIFFKFKWLPWNTVSQVIVITIPIVSLTILILLPPPFVARKRNIMTRLKAGSSCLFSPPSGAWAPPPSNERWTNPARSISSDCILCSWMPLEGSDYDGAE